MIDDNHRYSAFLEDIPEGGASTADEVSYDNTDSGLEANNVQDAIDELAAGAGQHECVIQDSITAAITVGGITAGDSFEAETKMEDMWRALLEPTLYPTFVAPTASLTYSLNTYYEVGSTIAAGSATVGFNAGAIMLNGTKQNDRAGAATLYAIETTGAATEYSDSDASSGTFSVPALTRATKGTIKIKGTVSYAEGAQPKDSKDHDYSSPLPAGSVSAEKTATFIQAMFYGISNSSTISDFTGLTKVVQPKANKTFNFTTNNQYMVFAYDSSYGNLTSILDGNGFEVIGGWTKSTKTVDGFSYNVYIANLPTTDTNAPFTFKF